MARGGTMLSTQVAARARPPEEGPGTPEQRGGARDATSGRTLSPRIRRVAARVSGQRMLDALQTVGVDTVMALTIIYQKPEDFVQAVRTADPRADPGEARAMWVAAEREADAIVAALAKIARVAARWGRPGAEETVALAAPGTTMRTAGRARRRRRLDKERQQDAEKEADQQLEALVEQALSVGDAKRAQSRRLRGFDEAALPRTEQRGLLKCLLLHNVGVATTMQKHLRALARLERWTTGRSRPWGGLTPGELAAFLRDEGRGGRSVPKALHATLEWAEFCYEFGWETKNPLVQAVAGKDRREARAAREQATPYSHEVVNKLLALFSREQGVVKYATGFLLTMAMAVLRYSDMDRTKGLSINKDSLYAYTWRSKIKREGMPWAMPRYAWNGQDVGGEFYALAQELLPVDIDGVPRAWMWPHVSIGGQASSSASRSGTAPTATASRCRTGSSAWRGSGATTPCTHRASTSRASRGSWA